jgi:hypothetical protein
MPTCGRSSVTTIFVREAGTGWTSAAAAANKCSNREAASNLERGNGLRMDDPVQGKELRVDGLAQVNGLLADGRARGNDPVQGSGLQADGRVQGNGLPVRDQAAAMPSVTSVLAERPSPKAREVAQASAAAVAACEVVAVAASEAAVVAASEAAAVAVVVAAVEVAADGDRTSRLSMMSFSSAISLMVSGFIASAITAASAPM